ncbi:protein-tyrosine sulfotransferase-like isoform X2 [Impatiens glandulifera]|uniref:protein-tyrosine sulfotransferase-like isoform X2 n=1 Tax=Impatiens glandulifera TaxID=253017 RepID=UPI001FB1614D|nr:protein-tyrosine sulfotransferase-like isoform X2 [Impatiens glandulifera]
MDHVRLLVVFLFLGHAFIMINAYQGKDVYENCRSTVKKWAAASADFEEKENKHILHDLLFFLHIPRTGGRTYFHCFLRNLYPTSAKCPLSYDKLRFDPRKTDCRLLVTHNDYSMMSKLPQQRTSVVTILRNPIDRIFSTYEFSVEVAARYLDHPNLTSATRMDGRIRKSKSVNTLDIWPWKYLVPWMRADLFSRRDAREQSLPPYSRGSDPYNMEDIVIPLHEYINDPIARDIIHNGATFQIAGVTNNSYLDESHKVRQCVLRHETLGKYVLEVAKNRLKNMLYVGITEDHKESATMFANVVGAQVIFQSLTSNRSDPANYNKSDTSHLVVGQNTSINPVNNSEATYENMSVEKLIGSYESCSSNLRKTQSGRRSSSFKRLSPANFTKEARLGVPDSIIQEIKSLNKLDMELYEYARNIFSDQHKKFEQLVVAEERKKSTWVYYPYDGKNILWLCASIVVVMFLFVSARRRRMLLKLKI